MVFAFLLLIYIFVCVILCLLVLIQSDKGGGISGAIGGGLAGASTLLGTQDTANILTRGTAIFATGYMVLCIILSLIVSNASSKQEKSLLKQRAETAQENNFSPASALNGAGAFTAPGQAQGQAQQGQAQAPAAGQPAAKPLPLPPVAPAPQGAK